MKKIIKLHSELNERTIEITSKNKQKLALLHPFDRLHGWPVTNEEKLGNLDRSLVFHLIYNTLYTQVIIRSCLLDSIIGFWFFEKSK